MEGRRRSARIQMLEKKAPPPPTDSSDPELEEGVDDGSRRKVYKRRRTDIAPTSKPKPKTKPKPKLPNDGSTASDSISPAAVSSGAGYYLAPTIDGNEKPPSLKVTETIRLFNKHYLHFVQEEDLRCKKLEADKATKNSKKNNAVGEDDAKRPSKRPDLKAVSKMMQNKEIINATKRFGAIPGIEVGHQFFSRCEMVVIGFHSHWLNGIDYIGQSKQREFSGYRMPLATAIVLSGQYEDDQDNYEEVVYTGQGGNDLLGNKRQIKDQVMQRGNLALKNCMEQSVPVRVVRGHRCPNSYVGKVYTYDGLYQVIKFWAEKGISGFTVFKFRLKRIEGQPPLTSNQVHFVRGRIPNSVSEIRGLVCDDISGGLEDIPIPATNLVDDEPIPPPGFTYTKTLIWPKDIAIPPTGSGCNCRGTCFDPNTCACAKLNGSDFPYAERDGGRLIEPRAVVFECGPNCKCGGTCVNRTSQRGLKYRLEVFRTPNKGWGVRSWDYIPSGAPICEYIGKLIKTDQIDPSSETNYVFDIDCLQTMKGLDGRERRLRDVSLPEYVDNGDEKALDAAPEFCIDGFSTGNISRFINHSCQPNLFVQCVLSNHHDIKLARVVLMAADNIPPLQELTYDYGYGIDSVLGPDGKIKRMPCYCGAPECRKRLY
ncbi:histone-lysine N-methyltransferase, H3 lysine-9 specific SUVH4 [Ipomoea triloba]|uniref:histone-lysine N-methyltransferase, H3 lysine-9 specific SUVH4 n=1 Tax=Ipomoea triloba TaxID=35885 RepID=UPI00125E61C8|nr:histone-lysine N-methyltransferase, H3 lysine-9 specific SUVH4 [Ipomoea triloba]